MPNFTTYRVFSDKSQLVRWSLYALLSLMALSALAFKVFQPVQVVPRIRLAPSFALLDQNGARLTSEDLRGKFVVYNFTYTQCAAPCYAMNDTINEVRAGLEGILPPEIPLVFVTISFDPAHDTPEVLREYANAIGADGTAWVVATAENPALLKTIIGAGFEVYYEAQPDGSFRFDPHFVLVDGWGIIRGQYRYETLVSNSERMLRHITVLADEVQHSTGANKLAYEAAHLFMCYTP